MELAIQLAPRRETLGKIASAFVLREMIRDDYLHFDSEVERLFHKVGYKTYHCRLVVVSEARRREPVFALVACKTRSRSSTVHVYTAQYDEELPASHYISMYLLCLRTVEIYAALAGATTCARATH